MHNQTYKMCIGKIELILIICYCSQNLSLDDNFKENILIIDYGTQLTQGTQKLLYDAARLLKSKGHRVLMAHDSDKMRENLTKFGIESIQFNRRLINKISRKLPFPLNGLIQRALDLIYHSYFLNKEELKRYKIVILDRPPFEFTSWIGWVSGKRFIYLDGCQFWSNETKLKNYLSKIIRVESLAQKIARKIFLQNTAARYDEKYVRCTIPKQKYRKIESWENYHLFKNNSVFNKVPNYYISSTGLGEISRSHRTGEIIYSNPKIFKFTSLASMDNLKQQHLQVEIIELLINEKKQKNLNFSILLEIIVPECDRYSNYTKFVHKKISEKKLTEHVKIVYHSFGINDGIVSEKLLKSHLFWHTANSEGMALVIFESLARNVPVIAFGIPSIEEQLSHRKSGLIAVPFSTDDFAEKVLEFTTNYTLRMELNLGDKDYLKKNFDVETVYANYRDILKSFKL